MKAELIRASGEIVNVSPINGKDFNLQELQGFVGGYIEIIRMNDKTLMVLDEEGKLKNKPLNEKANQIFHDHFGLTNDYIVGDVLVCDIKLIN